MPDDSVVVVETSNVPVMTGRGAQQSLVDYFVIEVTNSGRQSTHATARFIEQSFLAPTAGGIVLALVILDDIVRSSAGRVEVAATETGGTMIRIFLRLD
jgi:hypothetical protein